VQFYERDASLVRSVADFIGDGLRSGDAGIVIATSAHREGLEAEWRSRGVDVDRARDRGQYVALDADEILSSFASDGWPDARRFASTVGRTIAAAKRRHPGVRAFGEMVALLWAEGRQDAAIRLEELWSALVEAQAFSLLCAYPLGGFDRREHEGPFRRVCDAHRRVLPAESYLALDTDQRARMVSQLQQKATSLEHEAVERAKIAGMLSRREQELADRVAELAEANRRKDEFLAMLGHELRNPLAAVRHAVTAARLRDGASDRSLDVADRQLDALTRLVDDLLDVSRITQGKIRLRTEVLSIAAVVEGAIENARALIDERGHRLTVALPTAPTYVEGDALRLEQVLVNLLRNAAKFTPPGGRITVTVEDRDPWVELRVRDDGIGITRDVLPHVFDVFAQAPVTIDRVEGGLGIGLTIVRRLTELHRGTVEAHSAGAGCGAEFVVRLPMTVAAPEAGVQSEVGNVPAARPCRVLVVEDNRDIADGLQILLEHLGHEVELVHDGHAALDVGRNRGFDVALLDIGLPGLNGYEVARRFRARSDAPRLLVALTGYRPEDMGQADATAFDHYLMKPVGLEALRRLFAAIPAPADAHAVDGA
jgi:signal transduction histidine kinase/ActR/RegA family two-component response regulator